MSHVSLQNWIAIVSALIAFISMCITLWKSWRHHPEADWNFLENKGSSMEAIVMSIGGLYNLLSYGQRNLPDDIYQLTNQGDGTAYAVKAEGINCTCVICEDNPLDGDGTREISTVPQMPNGYHVQLLVWGPIDRTQPQAIRLCWTRQPTRLNHRVWILFPMTTGWPLQPSRPVRLRTRRQTVPNIVYRIEHTRPALWLAGCQSIAHFSERHPWFFSSVIPHKQPAKPVPAQAKQEEKEQEETPQADPQAQHQQSPHIEQQDKQHKQ